MGFPPTDLNARTGELTPPGSRSCASLKIFASSCFGQSFPSVSRSSFHASEPRTHLFGLGGDEVTWRGHGLGDGGPSVPPRRGSSCRLQVDLGVHFGHVSPPLVARSARRREIDATRVAASRVEDLVSIRIADQVSKGGNERGSHPDNNPRFVPIQREEIPV
eukprot:scaffold625_cov324-Pavlova_lutheri.AAC.20